MEAFQISIAVGLLIFLGGLLALVGISKKRLNLDRRLNQPGEAAGPTHDGGRHKAGGAGSGQHWRKAAEIARRDDSTGTQDGPGGLPDERTPSFCLTALMSPYARSRCSYFLPQDISTVNPSSRLRFRYSSELQFRTCGCRRAIEHETRGHSVRIARRHGSRCYRCGGRTRTGPGSHACRRRNQDRPPCTGRRTPAPESGSQYGP